MGVATRVSALSVETITAGVNAERTSRGIPALIINSELNISATNKAKDMIAKDYWSHTSPTGQSPWSFISAAGYTYTVAAENLAMRFTDDAALVNAWMQSSGHRENILNSGYKEVGIGMVRGVIQGNDTYVVVMHFASRNAPVSKAAVAPAPVATTKTVQKKPQPAVITIEKAVPSSDTPKTIVAKTIIEDTPIEYAKAVLSYAMHAGSPKLM